MHAMEVCRHFARGHCAFGSACRMAHVRQHIGPGRPGASAQSGSAPEEEQRLELEEEKVDPYDDEPCTFRQLREKYFGLYSEYDMRQYWQKEMRPTGNSRPTLRAVSSAGEGGSRVVCPFFLKGSCTYGDSCRNLHVQDVSQLDDAIPERPEQPPAQARRAQGGGYAGEVPPPPMPATGSRRADMWSGGESVECGICFESISSKGERFGMLENCDHAFCLGCIRAWRKQKEQQDRVNLRMCPVCRNESFFVVPCDNLILDPAQKSMELARYKREMSQVPCKAFDYGRGKCSLGTSCFYAHLNPDGTRFKPAQPRKMEGACGTLVYGEVKLSDFFA